MAFWELHQSKDEYKEWEFKHFCRRVRQEIRSQKWLYYLEWKRAKKALKRGQKEQDPGEDSEEESQGETMVS